MGRDVRSMGREGEVGRGERRGGERRGGERGGEGV